jgi:hypothetical protein
MQFAPHRSGTLRARKRGAGPRPNSGEVYSAGERLPVGDSWLARLAYVMEGAIPIGRWSISLDPLAGPPPWPWRSDRVLISMVLVLRAV